MSKKAINELLTRGVAEVIVKESLEKKLVSGAKIRVKFGIDPTGDCIHIGHSVPLLKLREFQDAGHTVVLLIGDHTAKIGDPSGRSKERMILTDEAVRSNMETYCEQAGQILDMKRVEVRYNSEWYDKMTIGELADIMSRVSISQALQRDDFKKRIQAGEGVSFREALYPLLQGYDSVRVRADVELGGTDQKFNLLMGRQIQKQYGLPEQDVMTVPLLEGLDGTDKMSKTTGNYIAVTDPLADMYGKVMSIPDSLLRKYFELTTRLPMKEIESLKKRGLNPRDAKMWLAREIVSLYHGAEAAKTAEHQFISLFQKHELPASIPELVLRGGLSILEILIAAGFAASKGEARRLVKQGGVSLDGKTVADETLAPKISVGGAILQRGKRHFVRIISKND